MEVPIYFPTLRDESTVRYRLHLDDDDPQQPSSSFTPCSLTRASSTPSTDPTEDGAAASSAIPSHPSYPGSATVTRLGSTSSNQEHVLTTVLLDGEPSVVSVALLPGASSSDGNHTNHNASAMTAAFELDVAPCMPHYQSTAKIQASVDDEERSIQLILVDREGMVLQVLCRLMQEKDSPTIMMEPVSASFHNWRTHVPSSVLEKVTPHPLNRARVGFLSSTRILMALNPYLLVLDVDSNRNNDEDDDDDNRVTIWSKDETILDMHSRSTWSRRLSRFVRAASVPGSVVDMASVSALAVARTASKGESAVACTLHCDGVVLVWTVNDKSATPYSVAEAVPKSLVPAAEWSNEDVHDHTVPLLASRIYPRGRLFACAVYVPTSNAHADRPRRGCLSVLHGSVDDVAANNSRAKSSSAADDPVLEEVSLDVVKGATALISMEFDSKNQDKCSLFTWFHQTNPHDTGDDDRRDRTTGTVCATYPPSHTSILCSQPVVISGWDEMLDRHAWKERARIRALQPLRSIYESDSMEAAMYALDRQYLRYIFRPTLSSSVAPPRSPSAGCVRRALKGVAAQAKLGSAVAGVGAEPVEVEVLSFMHRWRERDHRRRENAWQRPATASQTPHDAMETDLHDSEKQEELSNEVNLQASRWKTLLLAIWNEEQALRFPLLVSTYTGSQADAAITVRCGAISVIVPPGHGPWPRTVQQTSFAEALDRASSDAVSFLNKNKALLTLLVEMENGMSELVTSGDLVIKEGATDPRLLALDAVARQLQQPSSPLSQYRETLASLISTIPEDEVIAALEDVSVESPSFSPLEENAGTIGQIDLQALIATSSEIVQRLESIHDDLLGRALVMSAICPTRARVVDASKRMYLRSIALRWALSQMVAMRRQSGISDGPKVRVIEAVLHREFSKTGISFIDPTSRSSLLCAVSTMVVADCFPKPAMPVGSAIELPETEIINGVSRDYSKLHLVLLGPNLVLRPVREEPVVFERRKMEVALSLISSCASESEDRAHDMVTRAFDLLSVELDSMETTQIRIKEMKDHIMKSNHPLVSSMFLSFLQNLIASMETIGASAEEVDAFWSLSFNMAVKQQNWERAFQACVRIIGAHARKCKLKELVIAMVANGAVVDLQSLCKPAGDFQGIMDEHPHAMVYETAIEALEETNLDDRRYKEALFVLHAAHGDWDRAAEALDSEYWKTLDKLRALSVAEPLDDVSARKQRQDIVSDLMSVALAVNCAIDCVPEGSKYLISARRSSPRVGADQDAQQAAEETTDGQLDQYFSRNDLVLRSAMASSVATLLGSGASPQIAETFLLGGSKPTREAVQNLREHLLSHGYFDQGLTLASHFSSNEFFEGDLFQACMKRVLCGYLVPLSLGESPQGSLPSLEQLTDSLDALVNRHSMNLPPLLAARRSTKLSRMHNHCVSVYAMALLQGLTTAYSSASSPVALDVATTFLDRNCRVPAWLDSLLLWGASSHQATGPGLFAPRRIRQQGSTNNEGSGYLGDPAKLLHCYIESGRYLDACRVVTSLLDEQNHRRRFTAPNRLPEKGDIDYLPYDKIDRLWNFMDAAAKFDSVQDPGRAELLRKAQRSMKRALEDHFRLQKVSAEGLLSARAVGMQE